MGFWGVGGNYVQPGRLSAFRCQDLAWYLPQEGYRTEGVPARAFRTVPASLGASVNTSGGVTTVTLVSVVCELLKFDFSAFACRLYWVCPFPGQCSSFGGNCPCSPGTWQLPLPHAWVFKNPIWKVGVGVASEVSLLSPSETGRATKGQIQAWALCSPSSPLLGGIRVAGSVIRALTYRIPPDSELSSGCQSRVARFKVAENRKPGHRPLCSMPSALSGSPCLSQFHSNALTFGGHRSQQERRVCEKGQFSTEGIEMPHFVKKPWVDAERPL